MASTSNLQWVALMRLTPDQFQAAWRRGRVIQWLWVALAWLFLGGLVVLLKPQPLDFGLSDLVPVDIPGILTASVGNLLLILVLPLVLLLCAVLLVPSKSRWIGSRTLRAAVLAGESKQIPAVFDQPPPLTGDELPRDMTPFRRLKLFSPGGALFLIAYLVLFLALVAMVVLSVGLTQFSDVISGAYSLLQLLVVLLTIGRLSTVAGGPQIITDGWGALLLSRRPKLLALDDWGIRWRARGWRRREVTLPWHDIRAFYVLRQQSSGSTGARAADIYVVMSDSLSLAWSLPLRQNAARSAGLLLSQLVVTRTGRPLLDVTQAIETADRWSSPALTPPIGSRAYERRQKLLGQLAEIESRARPQSPTSGPEQGALAPVLGGWDVADEMAPLYQQTIEEAARAATPVRPIRMRARFYWLNVLLLLLVAAGICSLWGVNNYRLAEYYRTLSARIATETPLYSDPLTSQDQDFAWDVQTPAPTDTTSLQYAYGGYAMTGGTQGYTNEAMLDAQYIDAAIAVTARQLGSSDNDGVGLIARSLVTGGGESDEIIFYVSPSGGGWSLYHYQPGHGNPDDNWNYLDGGDSSAIHQGDNATNRLMLVVRGTEYLCYINGQFVARDVDTTVTASSPKFGYPGLYVNDNTTTGVFNDFAVYSLPPYQPLLPVLSLSR